MTTCHTMRRQGRAGSALGAMATWAALITATGGCSLMLDWDEAGLLCDKAGKEFGEPECLDGYSCRGERCIADDSVPPGSTCQQDRQCQGYPAYLCAPNVCRKACGDAYEKAGCGEGEFCHAFAVDDEGTYGTACFEAPTCSSDADCGANDCIRLEGDVNACLPGCSVQWDDAGSMTTSCASTAFALLRCQPVGVENLLACIPTAPNTQADGDPCAPVKSPCGPQSACIDDVCRRYCDVSLTLTPEQCTDNDGGCCDTGEVCCPVNTRNEDVGVCMDGPAC